MNDIENSGHESKPANPGVVCLPVARKGLEGLVGVSAGEATIEDVPLTFHFASLRPGLEKYRK